VRVSGICDTDVLLCAKLQYDSVSVCMRTVFYFKNLICHSVCVCVCV
jgi:hypothetical protein